MGAAGDPGSHRTCTVVGTDLRPVGRWPVASGVRAADALDEETVV